MDLDMKPIRKAAAQAQALANKSVMTLAHALALAHPSRIHACRQNLEILTHLKHEEPKK
jgi:hypothetical protein